MYALVVFDDVNGLFRDVYDKAYHVNSAVPSNEPDRGWTATWVSFIWPVTMTIFVFIMAAAFFIVYVAKPNPFNMLYDKLAEWMKTR